MKKKYTITSEAESYVEVEFMFDDKELELISKVLNKLDKEGSKVKYCPHFYIEDENGMSIM